MGCFALLAGMGQHVRRTDHFHYPYNATLNMAVRKKTKRYAAVGTISGSKGTAGVGRLAQFEQPRRNS